MDKIKVLVADDHPTFREGLCHFIEAEEDLEVVARSADGPNTVSLAKELNPDVAIIDVSMPGLNGIEAARQVKEACPKTAIIMVSAYDYESYVLASLQAGAVGYLLKDTPVRELVSAIRMVHRKIVYLHPGISEQGGIHLKVFVRQIFGINVIHRLADDLFLGHSQEIA